MNTSPDNIAGERTYPSLFDQRRAGVLLHPTSLPSRSAFRFGDIGQSAHDFVNFLADAGVSVWQMLPIGPTHGDLSPYQSLSAHAGHPELISLDWLVRRGWLAADHAGLTSGDPDVRKQARESAAEAFFQMMRNEDSLRRDYLSFCEDNKNWLEDFALFKTLRHVHDKKAWNEWPKPLARRDADSLKEAKNNYKNQIQIYCFEQFVFFTQWQELREHAKKKGVYLFGDMPIFVAHDSADVWAEQDYFCLHPDGKPTTVAGVPPDYFSKMGQHWGNPHYNWKAMEADGFKWWLARLDSQLKLFDLIRIDHFRGFEAFWEIPGDSKDAREGHWVKAPGKELLTACFNKYHQLPLVAENLGLITQEVEDLRREFNLPGMLVLQFGFDGNADNPHLPHNHSLLDVIYTGTHDNDTTMGWYQSLSPKEREKLETYLFHGNDPMPWLLIKTALASVSRMTIVPMQDFLELDGEHRMNMPGTTDKNWTWSFQWEQMPEGLAEKIRGLLAMYDRLVN